MINRSIRTASLALAAGTMTLAAPASAVSTSMARAEQASSPILGAMTFEHGKDRGRHRGWDKHHDHRDSRYQQYSSYQPRAYYNSYPSRYSEPVYNNTRVWRGDDGRTYCRKSDGTTGLIVGGAAGALLGRELAGRSGDRTLGAILGAAGGALLGKSIDSKVRCD